MAGANYSLVVSLFGLSVIAYSVLWYAGLSDIYTLLLLVSAIAGLGHGSINYVPWNIYTYIADVDETITAQRLEGIFAGIMTLTRKASQGSGPYDYGCPERRHGHRAGYRLFHLVTL